MRFVKSFLIAAIAIISAIPSYAVTEKEMEQAKAITAKAYLRYVNDGSGYLDDISVKSMSELNSKLKAKEKENIKAFNSVKIPQNYADWDKAKLVEFWSVTFFTSPSLESKGKAAKARVKKQIEAMSVSAPAKSEPEEPAQPETPAPDMTEQPSEVEKNISAEDGQTPPSELTPQNQEDVLADQNEMEKAASEAEEPVQEEQSRTWVYVLVLAILVAIVIWLVVYAANLMKRQPSDDEPVKTPTRRDDDDEDSDLRSQTRKAIASKNEEVQQLHERLQAEESRNADLSMELEREKRDRLRLEERLAQMREENNRLLEQLQSSERKTTQTRIPEETPVNRRKDVEEKAIRSERREVETKKSDQVAPVRRQASKPALLRVIYLGRANRRGIFVRADRRINPGNTIYRLDTNDGLVGTFHVVDEPEIVDIALNDPEEYLMYGCSGEELENTAGVTRIITESAGTAIFENGYWKVLRKSRIRYE